jgi:hypothetical protein
VTAGQTTEVVGNRVQVVVDLLIVGLVLKNVLAHVQAIDREVYFVGEFLRTKR